MTDKELKNKCTERAKIFQQAMESCHSSSPIDCIEWFADRISDLEKKNAELRVQIEKMKKYIKACWIEENLNDYSSYITNSSDEFRDLVKELNEEIRNGR